MISLNDHWFMFFFIEKAVRYSTQGRPGVSYLDFPGDLIRGIAQEEERIRFV